MKKINDEEESEPYSDFDTILDYFRHFRWWINFWCLGIPWFFFSSASNDWNLIFNIKWNYMWAGGNLFLIANTIFGFI
jgi:hypothetical protein